MKSLLIVVVALFPGLSPFAEAQEESPSPTGKLGLRATDPSSRSEPTVVVPSDRSDEDYPKPGTPLATATPEKAASPSASPSKAPARGKSPAPTKAASPSPSPAASAAASVAPKAAEPAVRELENKWLNALQSHDSATVQTLVADNYIGVTATGKFVNKGSLLAEIKKDKNDYESATNTRMDVRVHGDTAVVVGTTRQIGTDPAGKPFTYYYRWTDTWAQRSGQWLCIASQSVQVPR